jgi:hypothetical protein|tara:strand:+ start:1391 stop:1693 length:303 start_codon:yes stop_codon:yes gene_type:complete
MINAATTAIANITVSLTKLNRNRTKVQGKPIAAVKGYAKNKIIINSTGSSLKFETVKSEPNNHDTKVKLKIAGITAKGEMAVAAIAFLKLVLNTFMKPNF